MAESAAVYPDAQSYLDAVVAGTEPPDPIRVAAAKALLPFQKPRTRAPKSSHIPPRLLAQQEVAAADHAALDDWEKRAARIREEHEKERYQ